MDVFTGMPSPSVNELCKETHYNSKAIKKIINFKKQNYSAALAGNRTRASRVAGENSTTEPPVLG